ncbi:LapD/MoxY N-terminal periplasmic domain-containing protein [Beggiatoa leptomitoformis]|uniref:Oxygen sensor histidine kinase NreB n=1 Tax=Beggiatoa leptomitoformis TaxID=288004 RepID=A0A2N9YAN9_9GAMM|nr:LapD/MoxY N-terminal periplasmic domain-containing protein [Beggiatoa leptomitoformis]ALG67083.1 HAMP domain-containing protein [Beggiatoa leptomitoformis]AUI67525.1 HAMP domain-containing protein [Beggiatoa leptomitoformis]
MSLRLKISLFISGGTLLVLLFAILLVVMNARSAVEEEVNSTAQLTLDLLETILSDLPNDSAHYQTIIQHLKNMEKRRHLTIHLQNANNTEILHDNPVMQTIPTVPRWFTALVAPQTHLFQRTLTSTALTQTTHILLQTDPSDEIKEAWQESSDLLMLILGFAVSLIILLYIGLGLALRPLSQLQQALDAIEHRQYQTRLPQFKLSEFNKLAQQFNGMAQELQRIQQENQRLLQYSLTLQEEERRTIARELHDELGQCLNAIKADAFFIMGDNQQPAIHDSAQAIADTASYVYNLVKDMIRRLRPAALDELGLIAALQQTLSDWQTRYPQTQVDFQTTGDFSHLDATTNIHLYRIVQEGLTNVAKHANATVLQINLVYHTEKNTIQLIINDNGNGFDTQIYHAGLGLIGIRERVEALAGQLNIDSDKGQGMRLSLMLPLQN